MKLTGLLTLFLAWLAPMVLAEEIQDWRLQLLEEEGLTLEAAEAELRKDETAVSEKRLVDLVALLGSEDFSTRQNSQKAIERMGLTAKPWLDRLPESDDPEIAFRLRNISRNLKSERQWKTSELLRYAVKGLVREKQGEKPDKNSPVVFAELFRDKAAALDDQYRNFVFIRGEGLGAKVTDGVLSLSGKIPNEGDQRLVLKSQAINGEKNFPDKFRIEVSLKGTPGGEGVHHIGVSVGKVRALFHPGYRGGGFRFENIDNNRNLSPNDNMGFTPKQNEFLTMGIDVERLPDKSVKLSVVIIPKGSKTSYQNSIKVPAEEIGILDSIGLDRSGNPGGNAIFDNLVVELER